MCPFQGIFHSIFKVGIELAPLIMDKVTGKPKRDPSTGYMMNHSLGTTDVTQMATAKGSVFRMHMKVK